MFRAICDVALLHVSSFNSVCATVCVLPRTAYICPFVGAVTTEFATVTFIELPVDLRDGTSSSKLYDGARVPPVCVSIPSIFTTGHVMVYVPLVCDSLLREKYAIILLSVRVEA